jgi:hypothetical protein
MIWQKVCRFELIFCVQHLTVLVAQKILRELKAKISSQSKKNFVLEKDVRYLDSRIALLIQNRMALEEASVLIRMNVACANCLIARRSCQSSRRSC